MTKEERRLRHEARLEQKAKHDREMFERRRPWGELKEHTTSQATYLLEHPHLLPNQEQLNRINLALRLWVYPSFTPYRAWLVYRSRWGIGDCFLREVTWDRLNDLERINQMTLEELAAAVPTPSIQVRTIRLEESEFAAQLDELCGISLPVFMQNKMIGIDGETCGIAVSDGWLDVQLSWWCDGPPEWSALTDWYLRAKTYFEQQMEMKASDL